MTLEIKNRDLGVVPVLELSGRLVYGDAITSLRGAVNRLLSQGKLMLVLNLENLTFIDSAGLGALVGTYLSARRQGGSLKLSVPSQKVLRILRVTTLDSTLEVFPTTEAAIESIAWLKCERHGAYVGPPPCPQCSRF